MGQSRSRNRRAEQQEAHVSNKKNKRSQKPHLEVKSSNKTSKVSVSSAEAHSHSSHIECPVNEDQDKQQVTAETKAIPLRVIHLKNGFTAESKAVSGSYQVNKILGKGGFLFEAQRLSDGLPVALKAIKKTEQVRLLPAPGFQKPIPAEVALMLQLQKDSTCPPITQLLEWYDKPNSYVLILERPTDMEDLSVFLERHGGILDESTARIIMWHVIKAAQFCCEKGVLHQDIKLSNLLINKETLEVKLVDFACSDLLKKGYYKEIKGTSTYLPPECFIKKKYHGKSATTWTLGILLFRMVRGRFPDGHELHDIYMDSCWTPKDMSKDLREVISSCLQHKEKKRVSLDKIHSYMWFKSKNSRDEMPHLKVKSSNKTLEVSVSAEGHSHSSHIECPVNEDQDKQDTAETKATIVRVAHLKNGFTAESKAVSGLYQVNKILGKGGLLFEAQRLSDGLPVALKAIKKTEQVRLLPAPGFQKPIPAEVALMLQLQKDSTCPPITQLLEWYDEPNTYVLILERPTDMEDLSVFLERHGGILDETTARIIMWHVIKAAQFCCEKGVLHQDIKLSNLLINKETLEVKLVDFACSDLLKKGYYKEIKGTSEYLPPECFIKKKYHGKSATTWTLGILLFRMVCGRFPDAFELHKIYRDIWRPRHITMDLRRMLCRYLCFRGKLRAPLKHLHDYFWFSTLKQEIRSHGAIQVPIPEPQHATNNNTC